MRRFAIILVLVAAGCESKPQPTYKGKPFDHWFAMASDVDPETACNAADALAELGSQLTDKQVRQVAGLLANPELLSEYKRGKLMLAVARGDSSLLTDAHIEALRADLAGKYVSSSIVLNAAYIVSATGNRWPTLKASAVKAMQQCKDDDADLMTCRYILSGTD